MLHGGQDIRLHTAMVQSFGLANNTSTSSPWSTLPAVQPDKFTLSSNAKPPQKRKAFLEFLKSPTGVMTSIASVALVAAAAVTRKEQLLEKNGAKITEQAEHSISKTKPSKKTSGIGHRGSSDSLFGSRAVGRYKAHFTAGDDNVVVLDLRHVKKKSSSSTRKNFFGAENKEGEFVQETLTTINPRTGKPMQGVKQKKRGTDGEFKKDATGNPEYMSGIPSDGLFYTTEYKGGSQKLWDAGGRWGVSLGKTREEFLNSGMLNAEGKLNLADGRYLLVEKADGTLVIGQEARGIDEKVLKHFYAECNKMYPDGKIPADTDLKHLLPDSVTLIPRPDGTLQILQVPNHSALISRSKPQPFGPGFSDEEFAARCGTEVRVQDGRITLVNNQTGQLFGPNGQQVYGSSTFDMIDLEQRSETALAKTGQQINDIVNADGTHATLVQVRFVPFSENILKAFKPGGEPCQIRFSREETKELQRLFQDERFSTLMDALEYRPEEMKWLLKGMVQREPVEQEKILTEVSKLLEQGELKDFQAGKLAAAFSHEYEAMKLFEAVHAGRYPKVEALPDNYKQRLANSYITLREKGSITSDFNDFLSQVEAQDAYMKLMASFRMPALTIRATLLDLPTSNRILKDMEALHGQPPSPERDFILDILHHSHQPKDKLSPEIAALSERFPKVLEFVRTHFEDRWLPEHCVLVYASKNPEFEQFIRKTARTSGAG